MATDPHLLGAAPLTQLRGEAWRARLGRRSAPVIKHDARTPFGKVSRAAGGGPDPQDDLSPGPEFRTGR